MVAKMEDVCIARTMIDAATAIMSKPVTTAFGIEHHIHAPMAVVQALAINARTDRPGVAEIM